MKGFSAFIDMRSRVNFTKLTYQVPICSLHINYKLALAKCIANNWTTRAFAICLCRDWTLCSCSCWPSKPTEGVQGKVKHSLLHGIWWDRSLHRWIFLGTDLWSQPLHFLISTYWPSSQCLFGAVSQSHLRCYFPGDSPHFAPNKT